MLKRNSIDINIEDLASWYAVIGFTLPRTEGELQRFEKLHADFEYELTGQELNANDIFNGIEQVKVPNAQAQAGFDFSPLRMAARNFKDLPPDIRKKMISNQSNLKNGPQ